LQGLKGFTKGSSSIPPLPGRKLQPEVGEIRGARHPVIPGNEKSRTIVEYALRDARRLIGVATYRIVSELPQELEGQIPGPDEITRLLEGI